MSISAVRYLLLLIITITALGCANIVPPTGGKKDITPPKLLSISPKDSLMNTKPKKILMEYDEFITVSDPANEVQISPLITMPMTVTGINKRVTVKIPDTLLQDNTTYRISFGKAIRDLHEGNLAKTYTYTFSTTGYFDSLQLGGNVLMASTGLPDTGSRILLYDARKNDSAIVREKPLYVTRVDGAGNFIFKGLPNRTFRIYALHESNGNLIYDGSGEQIGFADTTVVPADTELKSITLRVFAESVDTTANKPVRTTASTAAPEKEKDKKNAGPKEYKYAVSVDTSDKKRRTKDLLKPIDVVFAGRIGTLVKEKILLSKEKDGKPIEVPISILTDSGKSNQFSIMTVWDEDALYTLKLQKGFAKDTAGVDALPRRYTFRSKQDDDYAKLNVHLPTKYGSKQYVLMVNAETDTVYMKPITDTMVHMVRLQPANYTIRVIEDKNGNGKWDAGDLFKKIQPEIVIPYTKNITMKAGWDNTIDFEQEQRGKNTENKAGK
ncbi:MAG: Ig-like domain-containing protein [Bacteroidota bacterium]